MAKAKFLIVLVATSTLFLSGCSSTEIDLGPEDLAQPAGAATVTPEQTESAESKEETDSGEFDFSNPPFDAAVYVSPDVLTPESPSDFLELSAAKSEERSSFDRRANDWVFQTMHVITASFRCSADVEILVNKEFDSSEAREHAARYARILGQIPLGARTNIQELWIHGGDLPFGGGNESILIHTGLADKEAQFLEELFIHESAHTSLDPEFDGAVDAELWAQAAMRDAQFVSTYAADYPDTEDIAESFGAFQLWATAKDVEGFEAEAKLVSAVMPSRLAYFESLGSSFMPFTGNCE